MSDYSPAVDVNAFLETVQHTAQTSSGRATPLAAEPTGQDEPEASVVEDKEWRDNLRTYGKPTGVFSFHALLNPIKFICVAFCRSVHTVQTACCSCTRARGGSRTAFVVLRSLIPVL